jgi:hypothetical protein
MGILALWSLSGIASADDLTDATEILKKADAAALKVKCATYDVTFDGIGAVKRRTGKFSGTYTIDGWAEEEGYPKRFHVKIKGRRPGSSKVHNIEAGGDGEMFFLVDHANKKAYEDVDYGVMGSALPMLIAGAMTEFTSPTPFFDEINANKKELKGSKVVGGEDCYEIHVVYADQRGQAVWCISKKDFLPRSRVDVFRTPDGQEAGRRKVLTRLVVDPKLDDRSFKLDLPKGYEKIDDFAP